MVKKILLVLICLISLVTLVTILNGQGPKKTITLPNGDVIHDLNGEWDVYGEHYGPWSRYGKGRFTATITQTGSSVMNLKGSRVYMQGELDKNGFKKVQINSIDGFLDYKGQISDDGNKIILDEGEKHRVTYTRK